MICALAVITRQPMGIYNPWMITRMVPHSCELSGSVLEHRNVSAAYVAQIVASMVNHKISVSLKALRYGAEDTIGFPVSYGMARRAKDSVLEGMYGTYTEAYNMVS